MRLSTGIPFYAVIIFLIFSCDNNNHEENPIDESNTLNSIIQDELLSGEVNNDIFLGFEFGMSEDEFWKKAKSLADEGKVYNHEGMATYDLTVDKNFTYRSTFSPEFYNDSLYILGVSVKPNVEYWQPKTISLQLILMYMDKYGGPDYTQQMQLIEDCEEYHWVDGNRHIEILCGVSDARIFYKDESIAIKKAREEEKKSEGKKAESLSDI